jgi:saccharopine dehydrogenase (NAD+, L-lysine-forming)
MSKIVGIRREDKNIWEKRVPLIPDDVRDLIRRSGIQFIVQPDDNRVFADSDYLNSGAIVQEDLSPCSVIFAIKEIPAQALLPGKVYVYFSHTKKGQSYNMPMLQKVIDQKSTLIDYELIADANNKRLVFFGRFAGLAGMIDALSIYGQRLQRQGIDSPFKDVHYAHFYGEVAHAKTHLQKISKAVARHGLKRPIAPFVIGITGSGHVSKGAQEILDIFPHKTLSYSECVTLEADETHIIKVVFNEADMFEARSSQRSFDVQDYYDFPEKYRSRFSDYIHCLTLLVNGIYWDSRYPRLVTKEFLRSHFSQHPFPKLQIITDISCDIHGAIECTEKTTTPDDPAFTYDPLVDSVRPGIGSHGVTIMAVDNLPTEFPRDASTAFSDALRPFVPAIVSADYLVAFDECLLPPEIKRAVVVYHGRLTPSHRYLEKFLH